MHVTLEFHEYLPFNPPAPKEQVKTGHSCLAFQELAVVQWQRSVLPSLWPEFDFKHGSSFFLFFFLKHTNHNYHGQSYFGVIQIVTLIWNIHKVIFGIKCVFRSSIFCLKLQSKLSMAIIIWIIAVVIIVWNIDNVIYFYPN